MVHPDSAPIALHALSKRYGPLTAVNNVNLEVKSGEIFGFLGLNGAGKTTTIRILLDLLRPTSGRARILGHDCQQDGLHARALVGYLPGELGLYSDLTGQDVLNFLAGLDARPPDRQHRHDLQERFELGEHDLRRKLREYSTGMKRKLGLIQAFQSDPPLLVLDEPTEGLDPLMQEAFYELMAESRKKGRTIFMSSHVLSEVERICDRIAVLRKGELVLLSAVDEARKLAPRRVRVLFRHDVSRPDRLPPGNEFLEAMPRAWTLQVAGPLGPLLQLIAPLSVDDIHIDEPKLEDVITRYYRGAAE